MILDDIFRVRQSQLLAEKQRISPKEMRKQALGTQRPVLDFAKTLKKETLSIIAEVKKASPSKGIIRPDFHPARFAKEYEKGGASAISCLTEEHYFLGSLAYLREIRAAVSLPILRKDFIFDPYQIDEARVAGADAILLIVAMLAPETLHALYQYATDLGLHCLVEVHHEEELQVAKGLGARLIGINNRNLKTFAVSLEVSRRLMEKLPADVIKVSESGLSTREELDEVRRYGADAVLMGEMLMRSCDMAGQLRQLLGE